MKIEKIVCDNCEVEKKDTNHWWMVGITADVNGLYICKLGDTLNKVTHACGQKCALEMASRWMTTGNLVDPKVGAI
jgi:hypothetical protein